MTRYQFQIRYGGELRPDPEGSMMPDAKTAIAEAVSAAREIVVNALKRGRPIPASAAIGIVDDKGRAVEIVRFPPAI